jgi:hypothetical protein
MATVEAQRVESASGEDVTPNQVRPIAVWAWIGFAFLAFAAYLIIRWLVLGEAHRVSSGPTPLPTWMKICLGIQQWGLFAGMLALIWFKAVRPRLRTGRMSFDGLLVLSFALMWWSDPMYNFFTLGFSYNAWFVNLGSWIGGVPGWMSPNPQRTPQPLIWLPGVYTCAFFLMVLIACWIMRRVRGRWPRLSMPSVWVITFIPMLVFGSLWEAAFMVMGSHQYASAIRGFALNPGKYYAFPLYQGITASVLYTTWAAMRYFKDDRGRAFPERGVERLGGLGSVRTDWVRFLAVSGATTTIFFIGYHLPNALIALEGGAWPQSVLKRSYLTEGLCGVGTGTPCPGRVKVLRPAS